MMKDYTGEIMYVKPVALDLGALAVLHGAVCTGGGSADAPCANGSLASGYGSKGSCESGATASCNLGSGAST